MFQYQRLSIENSLSIQSNTKLALQVLYYKQKSANKSRDQQLYKDPLF